MSGWSEEQHKNFQRWFPSRVAVATLPCPRLRLLLLHGAGMEQLVFTTRGNARNPMPNPLLDYCEANNVQVLAVQLPGRSTRHREEVCKTAQEAASGLFNALRPLLQEYPAVPYVCMAHSMGCFILYEFLKLLISHNPSSPSPSSSSSPSPSISRHPIDLIQVNADTNGTPRLPNLVLLSCCPSPLTPEADRPWNKSQGMSDQQLKQEAIQWDVNSDVFQPDIWILYSKLFRNDFPLFDSYVNTPPYDLSGILFPTVCWYAKQDKRVKKTHLQTWKPLMTGQQLVETDNNDDGNHDDNDDDDGKLKQIQSYFTLEPIDGHHGFLYHKLHRAKWMESLIKHIEPILQLITNQQTTTNTTNTHNDGTGKPTANTALG